MRNQLTNKHFLMQISTSNPHQPMPSPYNSQKIKWHMKPYYTTHMHMASKRKMIKKKIQKNQEQKGKKRDKKEHVNVHALLGSVCV